MLIEMHLAPTIGTYSLKTSWLMKSDQSNRFELLKKNWVKTGYKLFCGLT